MLVQPFLHMPLKLADAKSTDVFGLPSILLKTSIIIGHEVQKGAVYTIRRNRACTSFLHHPISDTHNQSLWLIVVSPNVRTGEIRDCCLVAKTLRFKNQNPLIFPFGTSKQFTANVDAQFQRHVQAKKLPLFSGPASR